MLIWTALRSCEMLTLYKLSRAEEKVGYASTSIQISWISITDNSHITLSCDNFVKCFERCFYLFIGLLFLSAFDAERERQYRANEKQLKLQIAQLEATLKGDLNDKNSLLDKLNEERGKYWLPW